MRMDGMVGWQLRLDGVHCVQQRGNGRVQGIGGGWSSRMDGRHLESNRSQLLIQGLVRETLVGLQILRLQPASLAQGANCRQQRRAGGGEMA